MEPRQDRRVLRTRKALIEAFNHLFLHRRQRKISVADIAGHANVGRSTFYDHYASAEAIHLDALAQPFSVLADAAAGQGDHQQLEQLLIHFWDNRQRAPATFPGKTGEKVNRLLAAMVEERLKPAELTFPIPARLAAVQLAQSALAPVKGWLLAEAWCDPEALAKHICRSGRQMVKILTIDGLTREGAEPSSDP